MRVENTFVSPPARGTGAQKPSPGSSLDSYGVTHGPSFKKVLTTLLLVAPKALAATTDVCSGYPLNINHDGETASHDGPPTVMYFTGNNGLQGNVVANMQEGEDDDNSASPAQLAQNVICVLSARCGIISAHAPNNASKRIPGYYESAFLTGVYMSHFNASDGGLLPQVKCIFDAGFNK